MQFRRCELAADILFYCPKAIFKTMGESPPEIPFVVVEEPVSGNKAGKDGEGDQTHEPQSKRLSNARFGPVPGFHPVSKNQNHRDGPDHHPTLKQKTEGRGQAGAFWEK